MKRRRAESKGARITEAAIKPEQILKSVADEGAGGIVLFLGTVRDHSEVGKVEQIVYESYIPMAEKRLKEIEEEVLKRWPVRKVKIAHRVGKLALGDVSVAVAVSAPHRSEAFEACKHAIERIKHDVPIWKKEKLTVGKEVWVAGERIGA